MAGWTYIKLNKTKPGQPGHWTKKKKLEFIKSWLQTGNMRESAILLNIPYITVKTWKAQPWFQEMVDQVREEHVQKLDGKLSAIIEKSLEETVDRLENGDSILDSKTGKVIKVKPKLHIVNKVANDLLDKQMKLRDTKDKVRSLENTNSRLLNLAEQFISFATGNKVKELPVVDEFIEGDFNAIPEERS